MAREAARREGDEREREREARRVVFWRRGVAREARKSDGSEGEGGVALRWWRLRCPTVVVAVPSNVAGGGGRRWKGRGPKVRETQGEAHAQRGPVRRCMADLETRSPQGETRGPKRRPRKIGRNSRESRLFLSRVIQRVRSLSLSLSTRVFVCISCDDTNASETSV